MRLDPVDLEILATKVAAVAEEMGIALQRSGRTIYVKETEDFGAALMNLSGKIFAYPNGTIGVSNMIDNDGSVAIAAVKNLEPGDVIITNHPYASGALSTHLPDVHLIQPYFHEGKPVCYGWTFVHSADVGGRVPSSISPSNHEVYQEGLLIPPMKLVKRGVFNEDVVAFIESNCRTGEENLGDLRAMVAALGVGGKRVKAMIEQHGLEAFSAATTEIIAYSAAKARDAYRTIPDGAYEFTDYLDDDYNSPIPVRIHARLEVADGLLHLDFTGTDPQVASAYNLPSAGMRHSWLSIRLMHYALTRDPTIPVNSGLFEPVRMTIPQGSLLNPVFPAAVGVRHASGNRVVDVLNGLLCQAVPDFMRAAGCGVLVPIVLAEPPDSRGKRKVDVVEPLTGGTGAGRGIDGIDARECSVSGMSNNPIESVEANAGVTILRYGIRVDSGGPGQWRGGAGTELTFSPHRSGSQVLGRGVERFRFVPWGFAGGRCAGQARIIKNLGRPGEVDLGKIDMVNVDAGETITILTPGGGGYGDPLEREPESVLADVERGVVTEQGALRDYGVVILHRGLDRAATLLQRAERCAARAPSAALFDFGSERETWDAVFDADLVGRIQLHLDAVPATARAAARDELFAPVREVLKRGEPFERERLVEAATRMRQSLRFAAV